MMRKRLRTIMFLPYAKIKFVQSRAARVLLCPRRAAHIYLRHLDCTFSSHDEVKQPDLLVGSLNSHHRRTLLPTPLGPGTVTLIVAATTTNIILLLMPLCLLLLLLLLLLHISK